VNKFEIRKKLLKIRKKKSFKGLKIDFNYLLKVLKKYKITSAIVGGYYPYNYEIDSVEILEKLEQKNFQISLPKINKNYQMDFFQWSKNDPLVINKYGIPEPVSDKILYPNILLVPLVAFDKHFNRIGYGGGFYDRYINKIKKIKRITTIGIGYSFQKVKKIPIKKYDIQLDYVLTDKEK
tara:strand:- start:393 stop:932 length:540 start_codon:yes stop_codon:yes gene_type:complete